MHSLDNQTQKTDSANTASRTDTRAAERIALGGQNPPLSSDTTSHHNTESKSEPMTQVQADSVLTREQLPNVWFRITVSAIALGSLLFVIALYYGIINP